MEPATQIPVMIYTESTPNPNTLKFVTNKALLLNDMVEFQSVDNITAHSDPPPTGQTFNESGLPGTARADDCGQLAARYSSVEVTKKHFLVLLPYLPFDSI